MLRRWGYIVACTAVMTGVLLIGGLQTRAENVSVSIGVGDTVMVVQGSTSPAAFVTIKDNGSVIGTTTANTAGRFSQTFSAVSPGLHNISIFARDEQGRTTDTITINADTPEHQTTVIEAFLPPTITLSATEMTQGSALTLSGSTYPGAVVTLTIDNNQVFTAIAEGNGLWSYILQTSTLAAGQHSIYARATDGSGNQSYPTAPRTFTLNPANTPAPAPLFPLTAPTITQPADGAVIQASEVVVAGTSQAYVQIELWDDNQIIGSVVADAGGHWQLLLRASKETYNLRARACSDRSCSRFSNTVRIRFSGFGSRSGFVVRLDHYRFTTNVGQPITLVITLEGGPAPYHGTVYWGDGSSDSFNTSQPKLRLTHIYTKKGLYNAGVNAQNARSEQSQAFFSVAVRKSSVLPARLYWWLLWLILLLLILWLLYRRRRSSQEAKQKSAHKK